MTEPKKITQQFVAVTTGFIPKDRFVIFAMLIFGVLLMGWHAIEGDWGKVAFFAVTFVGIVMILSQSHFQTRLLGRGFNRRHALYVILFWSYALLLFNVFGLIQQATFYGKTSSYAYSLLFFFILVVWMLIRSGLTLFRPFHTFFSTQIPIWEQILVAFNELIAAGLFSLYVASIFTRFTQPSVFTTTLDALYSFSLLFVLFLYWFGMQGMWVQRVNDWLSNNNVWVQLARVFAPLALIVLMMVVIKRLIERADLRTAGLLGDTNTNLAILALAPVVGLILGVIIFLVYTSGKGLRQRFLPDMLLDRLPQSIARWLRSVSDMDMLLMLGALATSIPAYLLLLGDSGGVIGLLRQQILQRGSALIETSEQALALLFTTPFYLLLLVLLILYALVIGRPSLNAEERESIVNTLPIGFIIILMITLYLFAVPFSQVLTEGRLPRLPYDLGRILALNIIIPLALLYAHYFIFIRFPYSRGQSTWRTQHTVKLTEQLNSIETNIHTLNDELERIDTNWHKSLIALQNDPSQQMNTLYHYVQINSQRDDLNMQRLQVVAERQQLAELSETPVSVTIARLPIRIVSIGIPLLLAVQVYQWAVVNNGLRNILNNPNLSIFDFFREILSQFQF